MSAWVTTRELEKKGHDGAIQLPFGYALETLDSMESCLPA